MNDLIKSIYDATIDVIIKDFEQDERDEVISAYRDYLVDMYSDFKKSDGTRKFLIMVETNRWSKMNKIDKQRFLLRDAALDTIESISSLAFESAKARLDGEHVNLTKEQADDYIKKMKESFAKIRPFNSNVAQMSLSESSVDFAYACNLTDDMSFRISHIFRTKQR